MSPAEKQEAGVATPALEEEDFNALLDSTASPLEAALVYARFGLATFPVERNGKRPATGEGGFKLASTDPEKLRALFARRNGVNLGLSIPEGCIAFDVDSAEAFAELRARDFDLPATARQKTRRGMHYLYALPPGFEPPKQITGGVAGIAGTDTRNAGAGYIVCQPSRVLGHVYRWEVPPLPANVAPAPEWFVAALASHAAKKAPAGPPPERGGVPEGRRNGTLFRLACSWARQEVPREQALRLGAEFAATCSPPMPSDEARRTVESAYEAEPLPNGDDLTALGEKLGSSLDRVERRGDTFELHLRDGARVDLGAVENALSPRRVEVAIFRATGRALALGSKESWAPFAERLARCAQEVEAVSEEEEARGWIAAALRESAFPFDHLQNEERRRIAYEEGDSAHSVAPVAWREGARACVRIERLAARLAANRQAPRGGLPELARRLGRAGFRRSRLSFVHEDEKTGERRELRTRAWIAPLALLDPEGGEPELPSTTSTRRPGSGA